MWPGLVILVIEQLQFVTRRNNNITDLHSRQFVMAATKISQLATSLPMSDGNGFQRPTFLPSEFPNCSRVSTTVTIEYSPPSSQQLLRQISAHHNLGTYITGNITFNSFYIISCLPLPSNRGCAAVYFATTTEQLAYN